jgi:hypothetical protein
MRWSEITPAVQGIGGCNIADMEQFAAFKCYCLMQYDKSLAALARPGVCAWPSQQVLVVPHAMAQPSLDTVDAALSDGASRHRSRGRDMRIPYDSHYACTSHMEIPSSSHFK